MSDLIFEFLLLTCQYLKPLGLPPPPPPPKWKNGWSRSGFSWMQSCSLTKTVFNVLSHWALQHWYNSKPLLYCCLWAPAPQLPVPWKRRSAHLWTEWVVGAIQWVAEPVEKNPTLQICCLHNFNSRSVTGRLQQKAGIGKITLLTIQKQNSPPRKISMHYLQGSLALLLWNHSALMFWLLFCESAEKWETRWCSRGNVWGPRQKAI